MNNREVTIPQRVANYNGTSRHQSFATGQSNFKYGYKSHPIHGAEDDFVNFLEFSAGRYFDGVDKDLSLIDNCARNAAEKANAALASINNKHKRVGNPDLLLRTGYVETNIKNAIPLKRRYPIFPEFEYTYSSDIETETSDLVLRLERMDYLATVDAYVKDAKQYIENCRRDTEKIQAEALKLKQYIERIEE